MGAVMARSPSGRTHADRIGAGPQLTLTRVRLRASS